MPAATRHLPTLAVLLVVGLASAQPAAALSGAYSEPGHCGGTAPVAMACTSQPIELPAGDGTLGARARLGCLPTAFLPCAPGAVRIDFQVTGFRPTSNDPSFAATGHCTFDELGNDRCGWDSVWGTAYPGDDVVIAGQVSQAVCPDRCSPLPPAADWCVTVVINHAGSCSLGHPLPGQGAELPTIEVHHRAPL